MTEYRVTAELLTETWIYNAEDYEEACWIDDNIDLLLDMEDVLTHFVEVLCPEHGWSNTWAESCSECLGTYDTDEDVRAEEEWMTSLIRSCAVYNYEEERLHKRWGRFLPLKRRIGNMTWEMKYGLRCAVRAFSPRRRNNGRSRVGDLIQGLYALRIGRYEEYDSDTGGGASLHLGILRLETYTCTVLDWWQSTITIPGIARYTHNWGSECCGHPGRRVCFKERSYWRIRDWVTGRGNSGDIPF